MGERFLSPVLAQAALSGTVLIYAVVALFSFFLLAGYVAMVKKKQFGFYLLYGSVFVVNLGYFLLSVSGSLSFALWANRISYLGSVFLPFAMLTTMWRLCGKAPRRITFWILTSLAVVVFLIAASPGISDIYYKEVSLIGVNGASVLKKVYGPLHPLYLFYLLGYFFALIYGAVRAGRKKQLPSRGHAVVLIFAMAINFAVWFLEQLVEFDFELLSISYVVSELFLLGLYLVLEEMEEKQASVPAVLKKAPEAVKIPEGFEEGLLTLTPAEKAVYEAYLEGLSTKQVLARLNIKENTLKYHNRNLYGKLCVSSRKELIAVAASLAARAKKE